jgi:Glu-tRNA(Gln) amidotransferase subunit E-like FAD-binding protein
LEKRIPHHRRRLRLESLPDSGRLRPLVDEIGTGRIRAEAMEPALDLLLQERSGPTEQVLAVFRPRPEDDEELAQKIRRTVESSGPLAGQSEDVVLRWAMGRVMPGFLGRVDPNRIRRVLREGLLESVERRQA